MNSQQYCIIPKNKLGMEQNEYGIEDETNILFLPITESEVDDLFNSGIINTINSSQKLLIDVHESDKIPYSCLSNTLEILKENGFGKGALAQAIKEALNYGTYVECSF